MKQILVWTSLVFSLVFASAAEAVSNVNGSTGLIYMPTAESLDYQKFSLGADSNLDRLSNGDDGGFYSYKMSLGTFQNIEMGIVGGQKPDEGVFVNFKYFLMSNNERYPIYIAVGMENIGAHNDSNAYLVASKRFPSGWHGHFGFQAKLQENVSSSAMLGAEYIVSDQWSVLGELVEDQDVYIFNMGARYFMSTDISFRLALLDLGQRQSEDVTIVLGVSLEQFI